MFETTASAAGVAMSPPDLLDIQDELCDARHGVQAAFMTMHSLAKEERDPLTTILNDALTRIVSAEAGLEARREKADA